MDNTSLLQIINRISLLKYRYIGSLPSDFVPSLPNNTFAIVNTQPSNASGEHWIMIARYRHELYFADPLGCSLKEYTFLKQHYKQMIPTKLQVHPSLCGFYTIYSAFHLFKFWQKEITRVHEVHVLNFISNFM